jgi:ADP-heptose:LPS heptosyltransferase
MDGHGVKINKLPRVHIVDRYLETVKTFHVVNDGRGLDYFIDENEKNAWQKLPKEFYSGYVGLVVGAALPTKKLPREKLRAICEGLPYPIVLLGGPEDAEDGNLISNNLTHVFNACGKFSLNESAGLVQKASAIITHDTGLMHIAAAFQKPVFSIWGNTIPQFGMGPYFSSQYPAPVNHLFEVPNLPCRPCSKIGHKKCPKGHFDCMQKQDIPQIVAICRPLLPFN